MLQNADPFVLRTMYEWSPVNTVRLCASSRTQKHVAVKLYLPSERKKEKLKNVWNKCRRNERHKEK